MDKREIAGKLLRVARELVGGASDEERRVVVGALGSLRDVLASLERLADEMTIWSDVTDQENRRRAIKDVRDAIVQISSGYSKVNKQFQMGYFSTRHRG